jgi:phenylacetic acid degradation operon negative regulatory protein
MEITERQPVRTQFLVFTLYGEYIRQRGGTIWTSDIICLLELLGVGERATRTALSRMSQGGWLVGTKHGRCSRYSLTERGWALLRQGEQRIFEPPFTDWDGNWHLVVYSLPEKMRRIRRSLRQSLTWFGYASMAPGTWISPHNRRTEAENICKELGIQQYVELFSGTHFGHTSDQELMRRCWDLSGLEAQYKHFLATHQKGYAKRKKNNENKNHLDPQDSFIRRYWLTHEFQSFPLKDPNLPTTLLTSDWAGTTARKLFNDYRALLEPYANEFLDTVIQNGNKFQTKKT